MSTTDIRSRLQEYIRIADEKKVKAIYLILEDEIKGKHKVWLNEIQDDKNDVINTSEKEKVKAKKKSKLAELKEDKKHSLSYSPEVIAVNSKKYILNFPLRCLFEKEDDFFVVTSELLDIIGTGISAEEAEKNFNEEFDFIYQRFTNMPDSRLSKRLKQVKNILGVYVKEVIK